MIEFSGQPGPRGDNGAAGNPGIFIRKNYYFIYDSILFFKGQPGPPGPPGHDGE